MEGKRKPILFWIIAGIILAITITLAVLNWKVTSLHLIFVEVQGRLIFILIIFFFLGFFLGKLSHLLGSRQKDKVRERDREKVDYVDFIDDNQR